MTFIKGSQWFPNHHNEIKTVDGRVNSYVAAFVCTGKLLMSVNDRTVLVLSRGGSRNFPEGGENLDSNILNTNNVHWSFSER